MADPVAAPAPVRTALAIGSALADRGLRCILWKSNGHLAEALAGLTDLDMFAELSHRDEVRACLKAQGCVRVISQPWAAYPDVDDWLAVDHDTGRILHLHLHYALVTGLRRVKHLRLPWTEALLANSDHALNDVWLTPTAEMELMILIVRMWAKMPPRRRLFGPSLPSSIRWEFDWLAARCEPAELSRLAASLVPGFDAQRIVGLLDQPPPSDAQVLAVSRGVYAELSGAYRQNWWLALARSGWLNLRAAASKELRKLRPATVTGKRIDGQGLVVAFVGSDGSGKSTLTREICRWLRYKLDAHYYYLGSGEGSPRLLDRLRHALKGKAKARKSTGSGRDGAAPRKAQGAFARLLSLHRLWEIRGKLAALREAQRLAAGGSVAVLDRLPQSQVNAMSDGPRLQQANSFAWAARAELAQFAKLDALAPHLVIKLVVSPEVAHARKPDHSLEKLRQKAEITDRLRFVSPVVEIDADQPLADVLLAAKQAVWHALQQRAAEPRHD